MVDVNISYSSIRDVSTGGGQIRDEFKGVELPRCPECGSSDAAAEGDRTARRARFRSSQGADMYDAIAKNGQEAAIQFEDWDRKAAANAG